MALPTSEVLSNLISPVLEQYGLDLEGLKVNQAGAKSSVRIFVAGEDGADLDTLELVNKDISQVFDTAAHPQGGELFGDTPYTLEVSTPGIDMALSVPRHFRRNRGRVISVVLPGEKKPQRVRLGALDEAEEQVAVVLLGKKTEVRVLTVAQLAGAHVEVEFNPAPPEQQELAALPFAEAAAIAAN